ncbi:hypothetical protein B0H11DRAFT_1185219 [Mycena galericulata]|nr:hypothetical protein B0H11DRAFT_668470 [Mycena galericulata]KAJ7510360.1 hypothetical protein B0H11DRAFT_1185219 [Mycena galericulata]
MTTLSNAGMAFPIPLDFDFQAWMTKPADNSPPADMDLKSRNEDNTLAETHNRESLRATRVFVAAPDKTGLDVGLALMPYWLYSSADLDSMVKSTRACDAVSPIPTYLCLMVEAARVIRSELEDEEKRDREKERSEREKLRAEKEKDKATTIIGNMVMSAPVVRTPAFSAPVIIPEIVLLTIFHRLHPPINWFTDDHLQFADQRGHQLAAKQIRPQALATSAPEKTITVLDITKMVALWGSDENHTCLSVFGWQQATLNFLAALVKLCPPPSNPPVQNFADEFRKHREFFLKLKHFERDYPIWYSFERETREQIMDSILFNETHYATQIQIILSSHQAVLALGKSNMTSPSKRLGDFDSLDSRKVSKSSYEMQAGNSFRNQSDSFRDSRNNPQGIRAPACFLCAGPHRVTEHPSSSTTFSDGKPLFACRQGGDIATAKPFRGAESKKICGSFNIGKGCQANHAHNERLHVCSFCGKDHPALSRHADCTRVVLGNLLP